MPRPDDTPGVVVVGGGHAGLEAAAAAARIGADVTLVTHSLDTIGQMSCNPAIGGIGKGHLVKEVDALDGIMGRAADLAGIHYRTLNASKGPAVRATRAQSDRSLYRIAARRLIEEHRSVSLCQGEATELVVRNDRVCGVRLAMGAEIPCAAIVLTAGTFLAGQMHSGRKSAPGGRAGDKASVLLADFLRDLGLPVGRLKTGTPPRIDGRTIDYGGLEVQPSETPLPEFCLLGAPERRPRQVSCHLTATTEESHEIVRAALSDSPAYSGAITGGGPRYCPSIEDKVVRFADRASHRIFLEPEGLETSEVYPNGISTAIPHDAQVKLVRSIPGLENARLTRPGYAIEYDYYDPRALDPTFAFPGIDGFFLAGQVNGTTGYEEAAAQGTLAGANAALAVQGREPWWPGRDESYIGVLADDLTAQGVTEPYRMFTSRAEHRLRLREGNADLRLTEAGRDIGLVGDGRWRAFCEHREAIEKGLDALRGLKTVDVGIEEGSEQKLAVADWLRRPEAKVAGLPADALPFDTASRVAAEVEAQVKYAGLIRHQDATVSREQELSGLRLPRGLDYGKVQGLSNEAREKLTSLRPATIGQAARIGGITPAAVSMLRIHLAKSSRA